MPLSGKDRDRIKEAADLLFEAECGAGLAHPRRSGRTFRRIQFALIVASLGDRVIVLAPTAAAADDMFFRIVAQAPAGSRPFLPKCEVVLPGGGVITVTTSTYDLTAADIVDAREAYIFRDAR